MWRQQVKQGRDAAVEVELTERTQTHYEEEQSSLQENEQRNKTRELVFNSSDGLRSSGLLVFW